MTRLTPRPVQGGYLHDLLTHRTDEELLRVAVPFVLGGVHDGDVVLVLAGRRVSSLLSANLPRGTGVQFHGSDGPYTHPGRTAAAFHEYFHENGLRGATGFRVLGDLSVGHEPINVGEWACYESAINEVFTPYRAWCLCTYDTRVASPGVLSMAERTHPHRVRGALRTPNPGYSEPVSFIPAVSSPVEPDPIERNPPTIDVLRLDGVSDLRREIRGAAGVSGLAGEAADEFTLAVSEVAANALRHGRPPVRVRAWASPGRVVCTVTDHGRGFSDPFAGFRSLQGSGRRRAGLSVVRQLCDQLTIGMTPSGFTVRVARNG